MATKKKGRIGGRQLKYPDEQGMLEAAQAFFDNCEKQKQKPEKAGLLNHLGISRPVYKDYKERYPNTLNYIENYIESCWVRRLDGQSPAGAIFYLKNAFKEHYQERVETDITTKGESLNEGVTKILTKVYGKNNT